MIRTKKLSVTLFHLTWPWLVASAIALFIAMHRNMFGPSSENMSLLRMVWQGVADFLGRSTRFYHPEAFWSEEYDLFRPALIGLGASYLVSLFLLRYGAIGQRVRLRTLVLIATAAAIPMLVFPHLFSSDVFDYIIHGRLAAIYRVDPYISAICEYPSDPFYNFTSWKMAPSVYGPAWNLASIFLVIVCESVSAGPALYVLVYKSFSFACHVGAAVFIWRILDRADVPTRAFGTALHLFNPLALVEFAGNGHNESLVILMVTLAIWLEQRGRWALASAAFAGAVQTKLYVLPFFCLYLAYLWWREPEQRRAWISAAGAALVFAATSLVLYLPFGVELTTMASYVGGPAATSMTKSLGEFFVFKSPLKLENFPLIGWYFIGNRQEDVRTMALLSTLIVCIGGAAYARTLSRAVTAMGFYMFWWCTIGATWFMPWYATVALALASLSSAPAVRLPSVLLSLTVFVIYQVEGHDFAGNVIVKNWMAHYYQMIVFGAPLALMVGVKGLDAIRALGRICKLALGSRFQGSRPQLS